MSELRNLRPNFQWTFRDPSRLGTWHGDTFYSDERWSQVGTAPGRAHSQREGDSMIEHYDEARHTLGDYIHEALDGSDDIKRVWFDYNREGPMGGISTQIAGYIELEDGSIAPFAINVYSDHNIERAMQAKLDEEERQRELRERLDS